MFQDVQGGAEVVTTLASGGQSTIFAQGATAATLQNQTSFNL